MEIKINLAGTILRISGGDDQLFRDPGVLRPFLSDAEDADREVCCRIEDFFPEPVGEFVFRDAGRWVFRDGKDYISYMGSVGKSPDQADILSRRSDVRTEILVKRSALQDFIGAKTVLYGLEAEHLIVRNCGILLHCSYISFQGEAILFTAPSGVGKSTQAELWRRYRGAKVINGDRAAVRICNGNAVAWGVPFSGSSGISHSSCLPVRAIVYLSQSKDTSIRPVTGALAFRRIWEGCSLHIWDREDVAACSATVTKIIQQVPIFHLACTPDESAVKALEDAMKSQR